MVPKTVGAMINILNPKWVCSEGNVYYNILSTHIWNFVKGHVRRWGHDSFPLAYNITRNLLSCYMVPLRAGPSALPLDQTTRSAQVQSQYATPLNVTNLCQATTHSWQLAVVLTALLKHDSCVRHLSNGRTFSSFKSHTGYQRSQPYYQFKSKLPKTQSMLP